MGDTRGDSIERLFSRPTLILVAVPLVLTIIQLIPVPLLFQKYLAPTVFDAVRDVNALFGQDTVFRPLSVMPARTAAQLLRGIALAVWIGFIARQSGVEGRWRLYLRAILAAGVVLLAVTLVHQATGATRVLCVYAPKADWSSGFPFINVNHAAVFMGVTALAGAGLALEESSAFAERVAGTILAAGFVLVLVAIESYGAVLSVAASLIFLLTLMYGSKNGKPERRWLIAGVLVVLVLALGATVLLGWWVYSSAESVSIFGWNTTEFAHGRLRLIGAAVAAIGEAPWLGVGSGATEDIIFRYLDWSLLSPARPATVEHEFIEGILEYGLVGSSLIALTLLWWVGRIARLYVETGASRMAIAWSVIAFTFLSALFHFPFLPLGLSVPIAGLVVLGAESTRLKLDRPRRARGATSKMSLLGVGTIALLIGGAGLFAYDRLDYPERAIKQILQNRGEFSHWHRYLSLYPLSGDVARDAAEYFLGKGRNRRADRLSAMALTNQPHGEMALFRAQVLEAVGDTDKAVDTFKAVFSPKYAGPKHKWMKQYLVSTLTDPEDIADSQAESEAGLWSQTYRILRGRRGLDNAIAFAHRLQQLHPDHVKPYELIFSGYMDKREYLLAEIWVSYILDRFADEKVKQMTGYALRVEILATRGKTDAARSLAFSTFDDYGTEPMAWKVLNLKPSPDGQVASQTIDIVERAIDLVCGKRDNRRLLCRESKAWMFEQKGQPSRAEGIYRRIAEEHGRRNVFIEFLIRNHRCLKLQNVVSSWTAAKKLSKQRAKQLVDRCHPHLK